MALPWALLWAALQCGAVTSQPSAASSGRALLLLTLLFSLLGPVVALPFVVLHGLGSGLLTIVRGTLPLALFGAQSYGARQGWLSLPGRLSGALAPWLMGLVLERWGASALWLTMVLALAPLATLLLLLLQLPATMPSPKT